MFTLTKPEVRVRAFANLIVAMMIFIVLPISLEANAQGRRLPLVRDAEIEGLIKDYTTPIFKAAGFNRNAVDVFLLNRNEFNAFVTGTRMFINTGAIMQAETPNEVIGVFAHETGHIVGGHLVRLRDRLEKAQILSVLGLLAGAGAVAGGSPEAGAAIALGSGSAIQRNILSYQREEEMAADRTGITLLNKTKQSGKGMLTTFKRLGQNPLFSSGRLDPYALSHPLPRERVGLLKTVAEASPYFNKKDPPELQFRHDLARAKIAAYAGGASLVRNIFKKELNGPAGTYGIAISHFLQGSPRSGLKLMDRLLKNYPNNPYFHEMVGEMYLKSGKASKAASAFKKAIALDSKQNGLLRIQLGHALIETNDKRNLDAAIKTLKEGIARDRYSSRGYAYMARAYAAKGNQVLAIAATAEEKFLQGNLKAAKQFAARAQPKIKKGSPQWLRLQDILTFKPPSRR
ncbi:MAG: M48 family metalloprotease [Pseudomonadota bacterium]